MVGGLTALVAGDCGERRAVHEVELRQRLTALLEGERDWVAMLATVACELHHAFDVFHWTGFYRWSAGDVLVVGPYQGGHGCLRIPLSRGICGLAARTRQTQVVPDVRAVPDHIACSSTTRSEIVVPILSPGGRLLGVLDVDSDLPGAFDAADARFLESVCADLGARWAEAAPGAGRPR